VLPESSGGWGRAETLLSSTNGGRPLWWWVDLRAGIEMTINFLGHPCQQHSAS